MRFYRCLWFKAWDDFIEVLWLKPRDDAKLRSNDPELGETYEILFAIFGSVLTLFAVKKSVSCVRFEWVMFRGCSSCQLQSLLESSYSQHVRDSASPTQLLQQELFREREYRRPMQNLIQHLISKTVVMCRDMGVSIVMGVPQARWMVYFMENPIYRN